MDTPSLTRPLGTEVEASMYNTPRELIGDLVYTGSGNTSVRIGRMVEDGSSWQQIAFITLTPGERDDLIRVLQAHAEITPSGGAGRPPVAPEYREVHAEPTEWQLEEITCTHCDTTMTRLALYGHECPELKASRERGGRLLEALSTLDPDEGKF